ncbi:hypothetical protein P4O66_008245, partial [Electrophorus voltai]
NLLPFICVIMNNSLSSGHVPTVFKTTRVVPILKKAILDGSNATNYRAVSLLSFLSKAFKQEVYNQLSLFLIQNQLHDPNQSGYKSAHSTETALLAVMEKLHAAKAAKLSSVLILLDLSAAFATVIHNILLSVLSRLGVTGSAWKWFQSYLEEQSYQVMWRGSTSKSCRLSTGVPQGSVLGPLLFENHSLGKVKSLMISPITAMLMRLNYIFLFHPLKHRKPQVENVKKAAAEQMEQEAPTLKKKGFLPESKKRKKCKKLTILEDKNTTVAPATARGGVEVGKKKEEKNKRRRRDTDSTSC